MNQIETERLLREGIKLFNENTYNKALEIFNKISSENSTHVDAHFYEGNIYHIQGQLGKAIKSFNKVLELSPEHTDASISLSVILNDIGKYDEAQKIFEKANNKIQSKGTGVDDPHVNKKFAIKHFEMAEMYSSYNRFDEAIFEYNKAISLDETMLEAFVKIAKVYSKKGFMSKAFETLIKLKNNHPDFIMGRIALGLLQYSKGNTIEAQTEWEIALAKDPSNEELKMYLKLSKSATETNFS